MINHQIVTKFMPILIHPPFYALSSFEVKIISFISGYSPTQFIPFWGVLCTSLPVNNLFRSFLVIRSPSLS